MRDAEGWVKDHGYDPDDLIETKTLYKFVQHRAVSGSVVHKSKMIVPGIKFFFEIYWEL